MASAQQPETSNQQRVTSIQYPASNTLHLIYILRLILDPRHNVTKLNVYQNNKY